MHAAGTALVCCRLQQMRHSKLNYKKMLASLVVMLQAPLRLLCIDMK